MNPKAVSIIPCVLLLAACFTIDVGTDIKISFQVNEEDNQFSESGSEAPCTKKDVKEYKDKVEKASLNSVKLKFTGVGDANVAADGTVTGSGNLTSPYPTLTEKPCPPSRALRHSYAAPPGTPPTVRRNGV